MTPYLSFVVAARNDNYGGNFLHRMQIFVNGLLILCQKNRLDAELIVVEWNPPSNKKKLSEALIWPKGIRQCTVRFIEVPRGIHDRLLNSDRMPMFEYLAKNVGIRRAKGEYVLATNPDLLYNEQLIAFLASGKLSPDCFYRVDRYDIEEIIPIDTPVEAQLTFCETHWFRVNTVRGTIPRHSDSLNQSDRLSIKYLRSLASRLKVKLTNRTPPPDPTQGIHTNASGDFFLMAKTHWHELRGYPELATHSFIDGYICFMAASSGLSQVILDSEKRIYHQEHDRSETAPRPLTDYQLYIERDKKMMKLKQPLIMNNEHWGLGKEHLEEYEVLA
jgi:hypothetical protein